MKTFKGFSIILCVAFFLGFAVTASAGTLEEIAQRGELRIACQTQGAPFSFVDRNGERTGSSVELCKMIAEEMGVKVTFLNYDWDGLIPALLSKKADMLAADMTPTLKRAMKIAFTEPYMYTGSVVFVKNDSPIKTLADVKAGTKIAVLLGSTGENDAKNAFPEAELKTYKGGGPLLINAVLAGHAEVGVNDGSAVTGQMASFPPDSIRILEGQLSKSPLAFAVRYDSPDLLSWLNLFFLHTKLDGRLDKNLDYWVNSLDWKKDLSFVHGFRVAGCRPVAPAYTPLKRTPYRKPEGDKICSRPSILESSWNTCRSMGSASWRPSGCPPYRCWGRFWWESSHVPCVSAIHDSRPQPPVLISKASAQRPCWRNSTSSISAYRLWGSCCLNGLRG